MTAIAKINEPRSPQYLRIVEGAVKGKKIEDSNLAMILREDQLSLHKKYSKIMEILKDISQRLEVLESKAGIDPFHSETK